MSVYVDALLPCVVNKKWRYNKSCHLIADNVTELIDFAESIGLKSDWLQGDKLPHFDLTAGKRKQAVAAGAIEIDRKEFVKRLRAKSKLTIKRW